MTLVVGMLMLSGVQASDIADSSKNHGFLSEVDSPFMIYSGKPAHPTAPTQDTMAVTRRKSRWQQQLAQAVASRTSKDLGPQTIGKKDEDKGEQKLFTNA